MTAIHLPRVTFEVAGPSLSGEPAGKKPSNQKQKKIGARISLENKLWMEKMMSWDEPALISQTFHKKRGGTPITVNLGVPRQTEHLNEWACSFQVLGLKDESVRTARGADGLQALVIAVTAIRKILDRSGRLASNGEPFEFILPRFVPISYGLQFHHKLCRMLDIQIEREERKLTRVRLARNKTRSRKKKSTRK